MSSKKESSIVVLQESITEISWRDSLCRWESAISHGSRRPQTKTDGAHQWEKSVISLRQRGIKLQRKDEGGRKCKHPSDHPWPKPSPIQTAVGYVHKKIDYSHRQACKNWPPAVSNPCLRRISRYHHQIISSSIKHLPDTFWTIELFLQPNCVMMHHHKLTCAQAAQHSAAYSLLTPNLSACSDWPVFNFLSTSSPHHLLLCLENGKSEGGRETSNKVLGENMLLLA